MKTIKILCWYFYGNIIAESDGYVRADIPLFNFLRGLHFSKLFLIKYGSIFNQIQTTSYVMWF